MERRLQRGAILVSAALTLAATLGTARAARGWEREPFSVFHERRARLIRDTGGDGVVVLFGYREADVAASVTSFRQNEEFYYLTGWNQPEAMILLVPKPRQTGVAAELEKEILYIPPHDFTREKWTGPKLGAEDADAPARTGFATVRSTSLFPSDLQEALKGFSKIYTELTPQPESGEDYFQVEMVGKIHKLAPLATPADLRPELLRMRVVKTGGEIALIRKAADASIDAHLAAMKALKPGMWEYEIAALMKYEFERRGCEWPAYPPIVGSGFFSTVLHYDEDWNQMKDGAVVVMDVAGAYSGYASDITRTLPVNGHFTPRQREIYEIVLGAQNAALAAAKPGMYMGRWGAKGLYEIAYDYINTHGKDLHGQPLGQYFIHGLSHPIGLNVHDPFDYNQPLEPGMVITVEPGIYLPEEKIGIRIEDDILITQDGNELLTRRLPRTAEEIEKLMSGR
ncbi:MAG: aminopeptidase P N-terminal domain-containing protein [Acidobacteriia bacterium]|nr:aminopeptidase P N-terminal domain-containing protein [Terriglobia bacterium]